MGVRLLVVTALTLAVLGSLRTGDVSAIHPNTTTHDSKTAPSSEPFISEVSTGPSTDDLLNQPIDLYGNEVTEAVAEYELDATGSLYETHSPQTEVPRLPAPKS